MYSVLDVKRGKDGAIEKIRVKNEKGEEEWYKANKFLLFAEAERYIDLTAASMAKKQIETGKAVGEAFKKGLMDGQGLEYGA